MISHGPPAGRQRCMGEVHVLPRPCPVIIRARDAFDNLCFDDIRTKALACYLYASLPNGGLTRGKSFLIGYGISVGENPRHRVHIMRMPHSDPVIV